MSDTSVHAEQRPSYAGPVPDADLAAVAIVIGHPSRARMLDALLAGRALAAGELARVAGIGRPAASEHLVRLRAAGLVDVRRQGRHSYYCLAGEQVASALETLALLAPAAPVTSLRQSREARALGHARACYDHLAGACGVRLHDAVVDRGWLAPVRGGLDLTAAGEAGLGALGVDVAAARAGRRALVLTCLDWTERRPHLAGALGAALLVTGLEQGWFVRHGDTRAMVVTDRGAQVLDELEDGTAGL